MADETTSEPPTSKAFKILSQVLSARGFILGTAAIVTAAASWFKPPDTTATKATYEVLSSRLNELSKDTEANHNDLQAFFRADIGVTKGEVTQSIASTASPPETPLPLAGPQLVPLIRKKRSTETGYFARTSEISPVPREEAVVRKPAAQSEGVQAQVGVIVHSDSAPSLSPREAPASALPPFDQVVQQASGKK
jgi:hypothetical protein